MSQSKLAKSNIFQHNTTYGIFQHNITYHFQNVLTTNTLAMQNEHVVTRVIQHVTVHWQPNGTDSAIRPGTKCPPLVYQSIAAVRMRQGGFQAIIPPWHRESKLSKCAFTGRITAVVGQRISGVVTVMGSMFTSSRNLQCVTCVTVAIQVSRQCS